MTASGKETILDKIVAAKRREVADMRGRGKSYDPAQIAEGMPPARDFAAALQGSDGLHVIAELKKASPSRGLIREDFDLEELAGAYEQGGAAALSVLTDQQFFQGERDYLTRVHDTVSIPVLRKDFIIDELQIYDSRFMGADAILLIVSILTDDQIRAFIQQAYELGLHCLVEVHDAEHLARAVDCGAQIIGVNSRDLATFKVDISRTLELAGAMPAHVCRVAESGVKTHEDMIRLHDAGYHAALIGETLMRADDPGEKLRELRGVSACPPSVAP